MILIKDQVEQLLRIIDFHYSFSILINLGKEPLLTEDSELLQSFGINIKDFDGIFTPYDKMFYLGRLASVLRNDELKSVSYDDFLNYFKRGQYISLTSNEQAQLSISKKKTYNHLKGLANKSKTYMSDLILNDERKTRTEYEKVIHDEIERGVLDRKSIQSIVSNIGHKLEDWSRDWGRIVETEMNSIFQEGKSNYWIEEDKDTLVFKTVYDGACRHCIDLYLTNGIGSQPIIFRLSSLIENGDNLNRRVSEWRAVVGSTHPFCRCNLQKLPKDYKWNDESKRFEIDKEKFKDLSYKGTFIIKIGDKEFKKQK